MLRYLLVAGALLFVNLNVAHGQTPATQDQQTPAANPNPANPPNPNNPDQPTVNGSATSGEPNATTVSAPTTNPSPEPEYGGPAILSRGIGILRPPDAQELRFQPYFSVAGIYDSGLTGVVITPTGGIPSASSYGVEVGVGVEGRRLWKKDILGVRYRGDFYHYTPQSYYDGSNNLLELDYTHRASKKLSINLIETGSLYSTNYGVYGQTTPADLSVGGTNFVATPATAPFDNTTIYLSTAADVVYQKSARLSFDFGGSGFLARRRSSSLYGTTGFQARGDTAYRLTRRVSTGVYYGYTHYEFTKSFGGSDIHTVGLTYSYAFDKSTEMRIRVGGSRVETTGLIRVTIDPVIAAILGQSVGIQTIYRLNYIPDISAELTRDMKNIRASLQYHTGVSPGNGLYLTSRQESIYGGIEYPGIRHWVFSINGGRDTLSSLGATLGSFTSYSARGGFTRNLTRGWDAGVNTEFRHYAVSNNGLLRTQFRVTVGVTFHPGERPVPFW